MKLNFKIVSMSKRLQPAMPGMGDEQIYIDVTIQGQHGTFALSSLTDFDPAFDVGDEVILSLTK